MATTKAIPRTRFTVQERVAIGELVTLAALLATSKDDTAKIAAAVAAERAANIVRGQRPHCFSDDDVIDFAKEWNIDEPASFNRPALRRRSAETEH